MKPSSPLYLLVLLLFVFSLPLYAQEGEVKPPEEETETPEDPLPPEEPAQTEEAEEEKEPSGEVPEEDLLEATLFLHLDTSDYYELLAWCRRLGLEESGSKDDLRLRLYGYYGQEPKALKDPEEGDEVSITQAHALNYFSETNEDQTYIRFTGNVELSFREKDSGSVHTIKADTLLLNEKSKLITAQGNVEYVLHRGEEEDDEIFRGESLAFDVDSWSGLFFDGISERTAKEENDIPFYYSGEVIYRSPQDTVILSNGVVTTSDHRDPYVTIRAQKIWVLAPREWAILNGVFYVGRIPVFYIPAFIKSGDDLFFNPMLGSREEKGLFYQTTTYLLGSKPEDKNKEKSLMNFLQMKDENEDQEIQGLFLRKTDGLSPFQASLRQYARENDAWIKLMLDGYSKRGFFGGIQGELKNLSVMKKLDFYLGIGFSREVFFEGGKYTPLYRNSEGKYESNWEGSFLFGQSLPFRYAFNLDTQLTVGPLKSLKLTFPLYSDSTFMVDFADRRETLDWNELFEQESKKEPAPEAKEISSQNWSFTTNVDPTLKFLSPYISTLKIDTLKLNMKWLKKTIPTADQTNSIESFFYPESYHFPQLDLRIAGTLFQFNISNNEDDGNTEKEPLEDLIAPWDSWEREGSTKPASSFEGLVIPEYQDDIEGKSDPIRSDFTWLSQSLSYSLIPKLKLYGSFDSSQSTSPGDIQYDIKYQSFTAGDSGTINYKIGLFDETLSIDTKLYGKFGYQERFDRGESITDNTWETYLKQDHAATYVKLDDTLSLNLRPLKWWDPMANSQVSYSTKFYLYQYKYDSAAEKFEHLPFDWDEEGILSQTITVDTKLKALDKEQYLKFTATLPPLDQKQTLQAGIYTGPLVSLLTLSRKETKDGDTGEVGWQWEPLLWQETFSLGDFLTIKQVLNYDIEGNQWQKSQTDLDLYFFDKKLHLSNDFIYNLEENKPKTLTIGLKLWALTLDFVMDNVEDYSFDFDVGWIKGGEASFRPVKLQGKLNYDYSSPSLWKNRLKWNISVDSTVDMFLQKFTDSRLTFDLGFGVKIFEFIDLKLSAQSENRAIFRYFPFLVETIGVEPLNIFTDLAQSFDFFNTGNRESSNFNLSKMSISLLHNLHDWDLTLEYSGKPVIEDGDDGYKTYVWKNTFSIYVQWKAMRDLETKVVYKEDEFHF